MRQSTLLIGVLVLGLVGGAALPAVLANHGPDHFSATRVIRAGNPASAEVGGVSETAWNGLGSDLWRGVDGDFFPLPGWAEKHLFWANGSSDEAFALDVTFYNRDQIAIGHGVAVDGADCATERAEEACRVPAGATRAWVTLQEGIDVAVTIEVHSVVLEPEDPVEPPITDGLAMPTWFTWDKLDLTVSILPPATGPVYDRSFGPLPAGTGLATDSPYVHATLDAIDAWEDAIDRYVADRPDAAWLADLTLDVSVVGRDATPVEFEQADIQIMYGPTGAYILGIAIASETDGDRFERCTLVNFQWLMYSFTVNDVYNIHGHEFGHCLGLSHPEAPETDMLHATYDHAPGDPATERMCLSSLNIRGLEVGYSWVARGTGWESPPAFGYLPEDEYEVYPMPSGTNPCPNAP